MTEDERGNRNPAPKISPYRPEDHSEVRAAIWNCIACTGWMSNSLGGLRRLSATVLMLLTSDPLPRD